MEAKFFSEIEKKMDVKTLKDFEKEVRKKIYNEIETIRKENENLSRVLMVGESNINNFHLRESRCFQQTSSKC